MGPDTLVSGSLRFGCGSADVDIEDLPDRFAFGAIIGHVDLVDIVTEHSSPFFVGPYGWVLTKPKRIKPIPLRGKVGLFEVRLARPCDRD